MAAEQPLNAAALARTGAGITLPPAEQTAEAIREAVALVLDKPSFARAAGGLRDEIAAMPTTDDTLDELIRLRSRRTALAGR